MTRAPAALPPPAPVPDADQPGPVPILLVDDSPTKRLALKAVLLPLGYLIVEADSGRAALRAVMERNFAVILLDVRMPQMGGFETAGLIRQRRQSELTPIIFITAYAGDEIVPADRYVEGAVDFIFAPVIPQELRAKVAVFANLYAQADILARRAHALQASADQLRVLTDGAPIGIFRTDERNRYVYTNPRWSEITGVTAAEADGRDRDAVLGADPAGEATGPPDAADRPRDGSTAGAAVPPAAGELCHRVQIPVPGASPRTVVMTARAVPGQHGEFQGWVGTLADVTAEAGAAAALADARDQANEASRLKSDFLANMSHEIRTPMNGVLGMTDLLLETELDDSQRDCAQTIRSSGEALLVIINDILDFSKVEAGKLVLEEIDIDLRTVISDVVDLLAVSARTKGLELTAAVDPSVPVVYRGDPGRVRQVLTNLIGNAIKFTGAGGVTVRATAGGPTVAGTLRFEVCDTGAGIAADKIATIFSPFVQADTSTTRRFGGTGLGLSISSQLVALMGGECGVSSQVGAGSTFWFALPLAADG